MAFALIQNNLIIEVISTKDERLYFRELIDACDIEVPDYVQRGWKVVNGEYVDPATIEES